MILTLMTYQLDRHDEALAEARMVIARLDSLLESASPEAAYLPLLALTACWARHAAAVQICHLNMPTMLKVEVGARHNS